MSNDPGNHPDPGRSRPTVAESDAEDRRDSRRTRLESDAGTPPAAAPPSASTRPVAPSTPGPVPPPLPGRATRLESSPYARGPEARVTQLEGAPPPAPRSPAPPSPAPPDASRTTRLESSPGPGGAPSPPSRPPAGLSPPPPGPRATRLEPAMPRPGAPPQRRTVLQGSTPPAPAPHPEQGARPRQAVDTRPMVAVLAAPGYGAGGEVFALRAGKNVLGAAPGSDVVLGEDSEVSGEHALILYRDGKLYLSDRMSTNGTRVNGETLDPTQNAILVKDKDWIRCGRTDLVLLVFDRPAARDAGEPS